MFNDVSVIIPVVRPDKAKRCIEALNLHCPGVEIVTEVDSAGVGCPMMVEMLTKKTSRQKVMFLGDDTIINAGALQNALKKMETLPDGWGVVGLHTKPGNDHAHWIADKRILDFIPGGNFFSTEYNHCYGDDELKDIAIEQDRWAFADDALVDHDHPINHGVGDEFYEKVYANEIWKKDRTTYFRRKRERIGGLLAIGFPLVNDEVPVPFFLSYETMNKPDKYTLLVPKFPHGPWNCNIDEARESIVWQALQKGASHLLFCDTDQTYPPDTINKLASHEVDVCGVLVHRRWPPFDPIMFRGKFPRYEHVSDEEMFSGNLVEVDATGTGCLLINMKIFDSIKDPFFKLDEHKEESGITRTVGEDFYFFRKIKDAGIKAFVDTSVKVGHLSTIEINEVFYKICKQIMHKEN